jgi:histidinol-phosphate aminotransferase
MSNWPSWLPLKSVFTDSTVYGAPQMADVIKLNTNENPFSLPAQVVKEITQAIEDLSSNLNRYPDADAIELRTALVNYVLQSGTEVSIDNIWAANGSNEILQQLFLAYASGICLGFTPSYSVHPIIAKITGATWISTPLDKNFKLDINQLLSLVNQHNPSLIFITSPNNPTGGVVEYQKIEEIAGSLEGRKTLLVIDEAYAEFSPEKSAINLINKYPQVVVVRTMSKAFAFAGARLGYLIANRSVVAGLKIVRLPYHLSALTQAAALVALKNTKLMQSEIAEIVESRKFLKAELEKLGLQVIESGANFLFFTGFKQSSNQLWRLLLDQQILIRDVGYEGYLRVSIGTSDENQKFLQSIKSILG